MKKLLPIVCIFANCLCFAGPVTEPKAIGEWSQPTNGLRGRLLFAEASKADKYGLLIGEVYLELQNVSAGDTMYVYYVASKSPLHCQLHDFGGKTVESEPSPGSDGRPSPCWLALPYDSTLRFDTRLGPAFAPAHPCLFICVGLEGGAWEIPLTATNDYYLSGTFSSISTTNETRPRVWEGTLKLPPVKISVINSDAKL